MSRDTPKVMPKSKVDQLRTLGRKLSSIDSPTPPPPPPAQFKLTRMECALLENDLRGRLNVWTGRIVETDEMIMRSARAREMEIRKLELMHPKHDASTILNELTECATKMDDFLKQMEQLTTQDAEGITREDLSSTMDCLLPKFDHHSKQAMRCRESAKNISWTIRERPPRRPSNQRPTSISQLPPYARYAATSVSELCREYRSCQSRNGSIPKVSLDEQIPNITSKMCADKRVLGVVAMAMVLDNQTTARVEEEDEGLDPPPELPPLEDDQEWADAQTTRPPGDESDHEKFNGEDLYK